MSGINGNKVTHDPSERLSYYLADAITRKRPNYLYAQNNMKQICTQCHTKPGIDRVYQQAEQVVDVTNQRVAEAKAIVDGLRADGLLKGAPFTNRIDFVYFDLWHYDGRTPFAAPLAYTGVGMLLLLNRMASAPSDGWARWILFVSLGGFFGNFVLSLTDHAENGFFHWTEWIPVASSSFAVAFLAVFFFIPLTNRYLTACGIVLLLQAVLGVTGFALHAEADLHGVSRSFFQNVVNGAPPFAPLLLPNLMILALIGLWAMHTHPR